MSRDIAAFMPKPSSVKKKILIAIDIQPIQHESEEVCFNVSDAKWKHSPASGTSRRMVEVTVEVPLLYEAVAQSDVREVSA